MSSEGKATSSVASFPIASILTIVFVVLKLTNVIDWSWWWVLSPLWIGAFFVVGLFVLFFIGALIYYMVKDGK